MVDHLGEVFPELAPTIEGDLKAVTLEQLLSHTSGIPSDTEDHDKLVQQSFTQEKRNLDELRYWVIQRLVAQPLQSKPGMQFAYANMGYMLAGAMLERVTGKTWEELIVERVFDALELRSAGLGPQSTLGRVDAPLGHEAREGQPPKALLAGPGGDNPEVIGPAGVTQGTPKRARSHTGPPGLGNSLRVRSRTKRTNICGPTREK